jgi:hypothetical protein
MLKYLNNNNMEHLLSTVVAIDKNQYFLYYQGI